MLRLKETFRDVYQSLACITCNPGESDTFVIRSDEGLMLETSASLSFCGGNLTLLNLFETKF